MDNELKVYDKLVTGAGKLVSGNSIASVDSMKSSLNSMGITVSKKGISGLNAKRNKQSLSEHGYSAGDVDKYKNVYNQLLNKQRTLTENIFKAKLDSPEKFDKKAMKLLTKTIRSQSLQTLHELFFTIKRMS